MEYFFFVIQTTFKVHHSLQSFYSRQNVLQLNLYTLQLVHIRIKVTSSYCCFVGLVICPKAYASSHKLEADELSQFVHCGGGGGGGGGGGRVAMAVFVFNFGGGVVAVKSNVSLQ